MTGSRWWFPVREGLITIEHVQKMGPALVLYLYCLKYATVAQRKGDFYYNHVDASNELGTPLRTIKRWFARLQQHGYITYRGRVRHGLEVAVTKFHPVEDMAGEGSVKWSQRPDAPTGTPDSATIGIIDSATNGTRATRSATRSATGGISPLTIQLENYTYPSGLNSATNGTSPDVPVDRVCLADAFRDLLARVNASRNPNASLREIYRLCFGGPKESLPPFSYLGKVARIVGGAGRLAELLWQECTKPPSGDILAYIQAKVKRQKRDEAVKHKGDSALTLADLEAMERE